jgi:hypothetical protein
MREIGRIEFVQVQRNPMKMMQGNVEVYYPDPLLRVAALKLTDKGIIGMTESGEEHIDAHHADHPQSRYRGENGISLGFLHFYEEMRERFGEHMVDGVAAENIIVRANADALPLDLGDELFIRCEQGDLIYLHSVMTAAPCVQFSRFSMARESTPQEIKATLQFLDNGRRGYYATLSGPLCMIHPGDMILAP